MTDNRAEAAATRQIGDCREAVSFPILITKLIASLTNFLRSSISKFLLASSAAGASLIRCTFPRLEKQSAIRVDAVAESDRPRLDRVADRFHIPRRYPTRRSFGGLRVGCDCHLHACGPRCGARTCRDRGWQNTSFVEKPLALSVREGEQMQRARPDQRKSTPPLDSNLDSSPRSPRAGIIRLRIARANSSSRYRSGARRCSMNPQMPEWRRLRRLARRAGRIGFITSISAPS